MTDIMQAALNGGELSPSLYGGVNLQRYGISLKTQRNFQTNPYGGIFNRPGFEFIVKGKTDADRIHLIPFCFSADQSYLLELGDYYMRVIKDGGQVLYATRSAWVTSASYTVGMDVSNSASTYRCAVPHVAGVFATDSAAGKWTRIGTVGAIVEVATPWAKEDLLELQPRGQSADILTVVHPDYPPQDIRRYDHDEWVVAARSMAGGPFDPVNTDTSISISPSAATGTVTLTSSAAIFTDDRVGQYLYMEMQNFGNAWMPGMAVQASMIVRSNNRYYQATANGVAGTSRPVHMSGKANDGGVEWTFLHEGNGICLVTAVAGDHLSATATVIDRLPDGGVRDSIIVTDYEMIPYVSGSATLVRVNFDTYEHGLNEDDFVRFDWVFRYGLSGDLKQGTVYTNVGIIDSKSLYMKDVPWYSGFIYNFHAINIDPISSAGMESTYKWAWQAWNATNGYPAAVTSFQQRDVFGGTLAYPQRISTSRTGDRLNMKPSGLQVYDDDALTIDMLLSSINGTQVNTIRHLLPMDKLVVLLSAGSAALGNGLHEPLTPDNITVESQGFLGASTLPPIAIGPAVIYQQDKGKGIRDLEFNTATMTYGGQDLLVMASHFLEGHTVQEWAYQDVPNKTIWMVRDDGILLGLTYLKEQQVLAWHRHDTGLGAILGVDEAGSDLVCNDAFESVCVVSEGAEDALYVSVKRWNDVIGPPVPTAVRCIERLHAWVDDPIEDCFFLDSALTYTGVAATVFSGLSHLTGRAVALAKDGGWIDLVTVSSAGTVTITSPAIPDYIGLPIQAEAGTLAVALPMGAESSVTKVKTIPSVSVMVKNTGSFTAGPSSSDLRAVFDGATLQTGIFNVPIPTTWKQDGSVLFRQDMPMPVNILAIIPQIRVGG